MRGKMRFMAGGPQHHGPHRHRARRGAIKGSVLRMLAERPMHGYELIGEVEERTGGRWRPSPGSVYPMLAALADEGLVEAVDVDGKQRYQLTDVGRTWLDEHGDQSAMPWERAGTGRRGELRRTAGEIMGQLQQIARFGSPEQFDRARAILARTRTELYAVLAEPHPDDQPDDHSDGDG